MLINERTRKNGYALRFALWPHIISQVSGEPSVEVIIFLENLLTLARRKFTQELIKKVYYSSLKKKTCSYRL